MNALLVGINAKFIHSNLAIRSIQHYAQQRDLKFSIMEFSINQRVAYIVPELFKRKPTVIGFSCYIWNFELIKQLVSDLKKILPDCFFFLGGPEVTYNAEEALRTTDADCVVTGEGEHSCCELLSCLENEQALHSVNGITYKENGRIFTTTDSPLLAMDNLPFVYGELSDLEHRILYYESMRGCPFQCQYCLSCHETAVRFRSLPPVFEHLSFFLTHRVRQVKFVDRTFNCNKHYALAIWKYLKEHDNGYSNFHFEIAAELLDDEMLAFLATIRKGFFQFEIGVQSTNPKTLEHIKRITKIEELRRIIAKLQSAQNIHLHLDLIIGLPFESYDRFGESFDDVYALRPDQLQVGFLKLLKGSGLYGNQAQYGIVCSQYAPYEVLYTDALPYADLLRLKMLEEMVEIYYNSNRFLRTVNYLITLFPTPFHMFEALATFYVANNLHNRSHTNLEYYSIAHQFFKTLDRGESEIFQWCTKFDIYSHEKARKIPEWLTVSLHEIYKSTIYQFYEQPENRKLFLPQYAEYDVKQLYRQAHIEVFPFNPYNLKQGNTAVLFNYRNCDLLGNAQQVTLDSQDFVKTIK